jgi:RNA polymerase sigma factor (TIGR02999 family)
MFALTISETAGAIGATGAPSRDGPLRERSRRAVRSLRVWHVLRPRSGRRSVAPATRQGNVGANVAPVIASPRELVRGIALSSGHRFDPRARMDSPSVTELLIDSRAGGRASVERLTPLLYDELRRIAHLRLRSERDDHTLSTTALVHEAYLRLVDQSRVGAEEHSQFLALASIAMRRVLVDHARAHLSAKRGGDQGKLSLDEELAIDAAEDERSAMVVALDEALSELAAFDTRLARVVECRYFGGLTEEETARVIGATSRTVRRDWVKAKGWLYNALRE